MCFKLRPVLLIANALLTVTIFVTAPAVQAGICREELENEIRSHLGDLKYLVLDVETERGFKDQDEWYPLVRHLNRFSRSKDEAGLLKWLHALPVNQLQLLISRLPGIAAFTQDLFWLPFVVRQTRVVFEDLEKID